MKEFLISTRYASAILKLAKGENVIPKIREDLKNFVQIFNDNKLFHSWLIDSEVSHQKKNGLIEDISKNVSAHPLTSNFIKVLIIKNRIEYFNEIVKKYNQFSDEIEHIERGVVSAINSAAAEKVSQKIEEALHQKLNKKILLKCEENSSLLGGITIRLKNKIWDASFKRKLEEIKEQLCQ